MRSIRFQPSKDSYVILDPGALRSFQWRGAEARTWSHPSKAVTADTRAPFSFSTPRSALSRVDSAVTSAGDSIKPLLPIIALPLLP